MRSFKSLALLLGTILALLPASASASEATTALSSSTYAAVPAPGCAGPPQPGAASCALDRLVPRSSPRAASIAKALADPASAPAGLSPQVLHSAYSLPSSTPNSATQTIALIDAYDDPTIEADLETYNAQFGLPACNVQNGCFRKVDEHGGTSYPTGNTSWSSEIALDVEVAHAICNDCHILLVETRTNLFADLETGVKTAVSLGATEVSNSYSSPEWKGVSDEGYNYPGVVITASSGDCGYNYTACKGEAPGAGFPADAPNVIGVGGTTLTQNGTSWASTVWNDGGSGCSEAFTAPAWQEAAAGFSATGCGTKRSGVDVAADGNPFSGAATYNTSITPNPGWGVWGGTSEASPIIAAEYALAGGAHGIAYPAQTLYHHLGNEGSLLNVASGTNGTCSTTICQGALGYNGPTGVGSPVGLEAFSVTGAPQNTALPTVSGPATNTGVLTGTPGTWSESPSFSYQWQRNAQGSFTNIPGATGATYTLTASDVNATVRLEVLATNASGTVVATSAPTLPISGLVPPFINGFPATKGRAIARQTLTITPIAVINSPVFALTYQWQRSTHHGYAAISGAISPTFLIPSSLIGARLRVIITASNAAGRESVSTEPTAPVKAVGKISRLRLSPKAITHTKRALITFLDTQSGPVIITVLHKGGASTCKRSGQHAACNAASAPVSASKEASKGKNALRLSSLLSHGTAPAGRYVLIVEVLGNSHRVATNFTIR